MLNSKYRQAFFHQNIRKDILIIINFMSKNTTNTDDINCLHLSEKSTVKLSPSLNVTPKQSSVSVLGIRLALKLNAGNIL